MSAIDRIMKAYRSKRDLNPEQSAHVHAELSAFIAELMSGKRPAPARTGNLQNGTYSSSPSERESLSEM